MKESNYKGKRESEVYVLGGGDFSAYLNNPETGTEQNKVIASMILFVGNKAASTSGGGSEDLGLIYFPILKPRSLWLKMDGEKAVGIDSTQQIATYVSYKANEKLIAALLEKPILLTGETGLIVTEGKVSSDNTLLKSLEKYSNGYTLMYDRNDQGRARISAPNISNNFSSFSRWL